MRAFFYDFQINGKPILAPDSGIQMEFTDLDSAESGRDVAGYMHRIVARPMVGKWTFTYSFLTPLEYSYMRSLIDAESGTFTFTCPHRTNLNQLKTCTAYISKYDLMWKSARTGNYKNFKFSIIEC